MSDLPPQNGSPSPCRFPANIGGLSSTSSIAWPKCSTSLLRSVNEEEGSVKAEAYLSEALQIAGDGPMPLYLADVHLHRARLQPVERSVQERREDLAAARALIEKHNYGRRREELEDAEAALADPPTSP